MNQVWVTFLQAYASTEDRILKENQLVLMRDLNARVGRDEKALEWGHIEAR